VLVFQESCWAEGYWNRTWWTRPSKTGVVHQIFLFLRSHWTFGCICPNILRTGPPKSHFLHNYTRLQAKHQISFSTGHISLLSRLTKCSTQTQCLKLLQKLRDYAFGYNQWRTTGHYGQSEWTYQRAERREWRMFLCRGFLHWCFTCGFSQQKDDIKV